MLPDARKNTTSLRQTVVIRSTGKKSKGIRPPQGRRGVVNVAVVTLLSFIILGSLLAVMPADTSAHAGGFNPFSPVMKYFTVKSNNTTLLAQQAATATAVTQDGYDPGGNQTFAGVPTAPPAVNTGGSSTGTGTGSTGTGTGSTGTGTGGGTTGGGNPVSSGGPGRFFYGQCTYWANIRYHALTGEWVPWLGNAYQWSYGASVNGWVVSSTPHVPSIIVLQPGVQGAGPYGHVAVVEAINPDGSVYTSNYNWAQDGGGFGILSYHNFYPGGGVSFVWY
jgi:surface antigen